MAVTQAEDAIALAFAPVMKAFVDKRIAEEVAPLRLEIHELREEVHTLREENRELHKELHNRVDVGVYEPGKTYTKWNGVTWDGSFWLAQCETASQPGEGNPDWKLVARRGKQGAQGRPGPPGPPGPPGRDATEVRR